MDEAKELQTEFDRIYTQYGDSMFDKFGEYFFKKRIIDPCRRYDLICKIPNQKLEELKIMIENLHIKDEINTKEKGNKLEEVVEFIFKNITLFNVAYTNKRNSSNEIDLVVNLNNECKIAAFEGLFPFKYVDMFLIECKNYEKKVDVTWLGKFYSLLRSCNLKFGIIFSIKEITKGSNGWNGARGLSKKLLLKDDTYILNFSLEHLNLITEGKNFIELIQEEKNNLDLEVNTDFDKIKKHSYQDDICKFVLN